MNYLLDTHVFLWSLFDDDKLSIPAKEAIRSLDNHIYISIITYWEIALKYALGKLDLEGVAPEELPVYAKQVGFETLNISEKEASTFYQLPRIQHKDPFDRLIVWQAISHGFTLISKDKSIPEYQKFGLHILW
jgi:PIN domain nuclease of toxin-antitoxin system